GRHGKQRKSLTANGTRVWSTTCCRRQQPRSPCFVRPVCNVCPVVISCLCRCSGSTSCYAPPTAPEHTVCTKFDQRTSSVCPRGQEADLPQFSRERAKAFSPTTAC
ncbi:unnamed protein product, partial [Ectocarpus sp. 8 AP-2014]